MSHSYTWPSSSVSEPLSSALHRKAQLALKALIGNSRRAAVRDWNPCAVAYKASYRRADCSSAEHFASGAFNYWQEGRHEHWLCIQVEEKITMNNRSISALKINALLHQKNAPTITIFHPERTRLTFILFIVTRITRFRHIERVELGQKQQQTFPFLPNVWECWKRRLLPYVLTM